MASPCWRSPPSARNPIPFYGELGSLNPVFVTSAAVAARGAEIADGYVGSFTLGTGQFCTKPGLLFLPEGHGLEERLVEAVRGTGPAGMLNDRIRSGHAHERDRLEGLGPVRTLVHGADTDSGVAPTLLATTAKELLADPDPILQECFGPTSIVVEYADRDEMLAAAEAFGGNLTATVHAEDGDAATLPPLLDVLRDRAGRSGLQRLADGCGGSCGDAPRRPVPVDDGVDPHERGHHGDPEVPAPGLLPEHPAVPATRGLAGLEPAGRAPSSRRRSLLTG